MLGVNQELHAVEKGVEKLRGKNLQNFSRGVISIEFSRGFSPRVDTRAYTCTFLIQTAADAYMALSSKRKLIPIHS